MAESDDDGGELESRDELLFAAGLMVGVLTASLDTVPFHWWLVGVGLVIVQAYLLNKDEHL